MSAPPLRRHGDNVKPHYVAALGEAGSWVGKSTAEERLDGKVTGIVKRYAKRGRACMYATSFGLIFGASADAIRYGIPSEIGARGLSLVGGFLSIGAATVMLEMTPFYSVYEWPVKTFLDPMLWLIAPLPTLGLFAIALWSIRLELFRPIDEPTIFDRKHRKVYRMFCEAQPGLKGLFKPWPMRAVEYDWDLIDVEHNAQMVTSGATVRRDSSLVFIVRKAAHDPTIIDSFNIGSSMLFNGLDDAVNATYEHIRRFMEDGGPLVPEGELLPRPTPRKGFWAKLWMATPFSASYWRAWQAELPMMLLAHAIFPLTIVLGGLWLIFNWLATATSRPIEWPQEVIDAVGPQIAAPRSANEVVEATNTDEEADASAALASQSIDEPSEQRSPVISLLLYLAAVYVFFAGLLGVGGVPHLGWWGSVGAFFGICFLAWLAQIMLGLRRASQAKVLSVTVANNCTTPLLPDKRGGDGARSEGGDE